MKRLCGYLSLVLAFAIGKICFADSLSKVELIESEILGYTVQYQVYLPKNYPVLEKLPSLYVTDGPHYIKSGKMIRTLNNLISRGKIEPLVVIFIDSLVPNQPKKDRRRYELSCNSQYMSFLSNELIHRIDSRFKTSRLAKSRGILGHSLGGLNAACIGLIASDKWNNIGVLSLAMGSFPQLIDLFREVEKRPLKFFVSAGTINDNEKTTRRFYRVLKEEGYEVKFKINRGEGHDWTNWKTLLDDTLIYFYEKNSQ